MANNQTLSLAILVEDALLGCDHCKSIFIHVSEDLIQYPDTLNEMIQCLGQQSDARAAQALVLVIDVPLVAERAPFVASTFHPLVGLGCKLSVSGFGNRSSSLELLCRHLPLSFLCIDAGLIQDALESERARTLVSEIQHQSHGLGLVSIAKQIQNHETLRLAKDLGIDWGQGYLLGVPTDPASPLSARSGDQTPSL